MNQVEHNKQRLREFVRAVWEVRDLSALPRYWTADCVNHADPAANKVGLAALHAYHEGFFTGFLPAFSNWTIDYVQQVGEGDRVTTQMIFSGEHTGTLFQHPPTGKIVSLASIRIDRFEGGKIAEHWSVADVAGLIEQIRKPA